MDPSEPATLLAKGYGETAVEKPGGEPIESDCQRPTLPVRLILGSAMSLSGRMSEISGTTDTADRDPAGIASF
jgi:hypothetical protein